MINLFTSWALYLLITLMSSNSFADGGTGTTNALKRNGEKNVQNVVTTQEPKIQCPANETSNRNHTCVQQCVLHECYHGGKCYMEAENVSKCICPTRGTTIYGGDHCEIKAIHLELSLAAIIGLTAGVGGFIVILLVTVIIALSCRQIREDRQNNKESISEEGINSSQANGLTLAQKEEINSAFVRTSDIITAPNLQSARQTIELRPSNGSDVPFGYKDPTREHHYARNSLNSPVIYPNIHNDNGTTTTERRLTNRSVDVKYPFYSETGVISNHLHKHKKSHAPATRHATQREMQFIEKNPDYQNEGELLALNAPRMTFEQQSQTEPELLLGGKQDGGHSTNWVFLSQP